jgi:hypothetical protein
MESASIAASVPSGFLMSRGIIPKYTTRSCSRRGVPRMHSMKQAAGREGNFLPDTRRTARKRPRKNPASDAVTESSIVSFVPDMKKGTYASRMFQLKSNIIPLPYFFKLARTFSSGFVLNHSS